VHKRGFKNSSEGKFVQNFTIYFPCTWIGLSINCIHKQNTKSSKSEIERQFAMQGDIFWKARDLCARWVHVIERW